VAASRTFSDKVTLEGELVTLRPIEARDADVIDTILREDPEVARLTGSVNGSHEEPDFLPLPRLREIYDGWSRADDRLVWAIIDKATGAVVGEAVLNDWDEANHACNFRTFVGASGRGRGLGTEATRLVVAHGLGALGLHRIALEVYAFNPRARHVYEKVGFVHEGTGREALRFDDGWVDVDYLAILATD
jgi:RimJ/RimL family protein N-acetyltransferase